MSQEVKTDIVDIIHRLEELEKKIQDYENCKQEFDKLKKQVEELITLDFAPINEHMRRWDKRDVYLFRTKLLLKKYIYTPIHLGIKTIFVVVGKLFITLLIGILSGILLNIIGLGTLFKNIVNFFSHLFN